MRSNVHPDVAYGRDQGRIRAILKPKPASHFGLIFAFSILFGWILNLSFFLWVGSSFPVWAQLLGILIQTHLYTGIFITLHDSVHGSITPNRKLNRAIGYACAKIFAFNNYSRLSRKHHLHHKHVTSSEDPDFAENQNFIRWYISFVLAYVDGWQILFMAITFNVLKLWFPAESLILFWILPSVLSTFQLFYFGTYLPHRHPEELESPNKSRSQPLNHTLAFFSCYFFGYHEEHHMAPYLPWWKLAKAKEDLKKAVPDTETRSYFVSKLEL